MPTSTTIPSPGAETADDLEPDEGIGGLLDEFEPSQVKIPDSTSAAPRHVAASALDPFGFEVPVVVPVDTTSDELAEKIGNAQGPSASERFDYRRNALSETIVTTIVALLVLVLIYSLIGSHRSVLVTSIALAGLATVAFVTIRMTLSPDRLRAVQAKQTLSLASKTLVYMRGGLSVENCQAVCNLLLPETLAMAVAMTDDKNVLGYAGKHAEFFPVGSPIHTEATHHVLASQQIEVFTTTVEPDRQLFKIPSLKDPTAEDINFLDRLFQRDDPSNESENSSSIIPAGIVAPLIVRGNSVGTIKLYYDAPHLIDHTQRAIAEGLAELLSTQLAMSELDRQVELTTKAELHALQSQINPHFLFNTINTIASLIRTDPARARDLLREFAVFYRQTLENSTGLIPFGREIEQTRRYLSFAQARFGENRIAVDFDLEPDLEELLRVPSFIIQPIVENSVNHALRAEGTLHIRIEAYSNQNDVVMLVSDDGLGMNDDQAANLLREAGPTEKGTGIALRNVDGRLKACFGSGSGVTVSSAVGEGTVVTLLLIDALEDDE